MTAGGKRSGLTTLAALPPLEHASKSEGARGAEDSTGGAGVPGPAPLPQLGESPRRRSQGGSNSSHVRGASLGPLPSLPASARDRGLAAPVELPKGRSHSISPAVPLQPLQPLQERACAGPGPTAPSASTFVRGRRRGVSTSRLSPLEGASAPSSLPAVPGAGSVLRPSCPWESGGSGATAANAANASAAGASAGEADGEFAGRAAPGSAEPPPPPFEDLEDLDEMRLTGLNATLVTRAEAERAFHASFYEDLDRGSSPNAAAAEAIRRCRSSSATSPDDIDDELAAARAGLAGGVPALSASAALAAALEPRPPGTEKATSQSRFFNQSRRLLLKESKSSTSGTAVSA